MCESRLLVAESDYTMQRLLFSQLCARGFDILTVDNRDEVIRAVADYEPDLLLLDNCTFGADAVDVCRQIREWSTIPIILLSREDSPKAREAALEVGADDVVTKPFYMGELVARIRAVLRRAGAALPQLQAVVQIGELTIDLRRREVRRGDQLEHLTKTEFDILQQFLSNSDRVLTYQYLIDTVWGGGYDDRRLVQVHVSNLRRKIENSIDGPRYITALPGVGYRCTFN
jgi:two-component system KDP operon response regulator KdpE